MFQWLSPLISCIPKVSFSFLHFFSLIQRYWGCLLFPQEAIWLWFFPTQPSSKHPHQVDLHFSTTVSSLSSLPFPCFCLYVQRRERKKGVPVLKCKVPRVGTFALIEILPHSGTWRTSWPKAWFSIWGPKQKQRVPSPALVHTFLHTEKN